MNGHIFDIKRYAIHDGPGIRVTVFFKGCPLDCRWCHNPEGKGFGQEGGGEMSVQELIREVEKDSIFMEESGGGVTLSGGEPLYQPEFLKAVLEESKAQGIHTTLDTCGYSDPRVFDSLIDMVDLFYYDLKFIDDKMHINHTGVSNESILRNLNAMDEREKSTFIRFPVIPTITDSDKNVRETGDFVASLKNIRSVDLLPYHKTAEGKYRRLALVNKIEGLEPPSTQMIEAIRDRFQELDLIVTIGGNR
jgi:pyruvate formate lyase activating enzyme